MGFITYAPEPAVPVGALGVAVIEEIATKSFDQLFDRGVLGLFCAVLLLGLIFAGIVIKFLYGEGRKRDERHEATLERVITVAEGYKTSVVTMATAVDELKAVQNKLVQAVADLAREAEGESRESRHTMANIMQAVSATLRFLEKMDERRRAP